MASLTGTWKDQENPSCALFVQGGDPTYTFRASLSGAPLSSGVIARAPDGTYVATGHGLGGPVSLRMWLPEPNTLVSQNQVLLDGGILDTLVGAFMPQFGALMPRPKTVWLRERPTQADAEEHVGHRQARKAEATRVLSDLELLDQLMSQEAETSAKESPTTAAPAPEPDNDPMEEVRRLIGMGEVKHEIKKLNAWAWRQRQMSEKGLVAEAPSMHMCLSGGPGTGKTTIARIIGRLLKRYGLLDHGRVKEVRRADLVGEYVGQTSPKTEKVVEEALGGVLFIDEAYALSEPGGPGGRDYGAESLTALIAGMENHRRVLCVIMAGYPEEMLRFIDTNPGLASRISRHIRFPDFSEPELQQIFEAMAAEMGLVVDPGILASFQPHARRAKAAVSPRQWGNARWVRNVLESGIEHQSLRLINSSIQPPTKEQLLRLEVADFAFLGT
jgi:stage V sporulation protein K